VRRADARARLDDSGQPVEHPHIETVFDTGGDGSLHPKARTLH